jgi:hypothetical protein
MKNKSTKTVWLAVVAIVVAAVGWYVYHSSQNVPTSTNGPIITSFDVHDGSFVVEGSNLALVEVWGVPTGTGVTPDAYQRIGDMSLEASSTDVAQTWMLGVPAKPMLLAQVFARGYGTGGATTSDVYLPQTGATAINDLLWGSTNNTGQQAIVLSVGESAELDGLTITLEKILEDSRCPQGAQCIQAGTVRARIVASAGDIPAVTTELVLEKPHDVLGSELVMTEVTPEPALETTITPDMYQVRIIAVPKGGLGNGTPQTLTEADNGKTFVFGVTDRFSVVLPETSIADSLATCTPDGVIGGITNIIDAPKGERAVRFEAVAPGVCTLTWGQFSATIRVVAQ